MNIKIERVIAENCGPLKKFDETFNNLTLIYGKNERGKSFLVEFIIQCLFKPQNAWGKQRTSGIGKVIVSGINGDKKEFTTKKTSKKLEDYFANTDNALPLSYFPLLVVKEGETKIDTDKEGGISKDTIMELLSSRRTFETLKSKISPTINDSKITHDGIEISKRGEGNKYITLKNELIKIEQLIAKVNDQFDIGTLIQLQIQKDELIKEKDIIINAKRHRAYLLSQELNKKLEEYKKIPEETINHLNELYTEWQKKNELLKNKYRELSQLSEILKNKKSIEDSFKQQKKALGYKAYMLAQKISELEIQLLEYNERDINKIEQKITEYRTKKNLYEENAKQIASLKEKSKDYEWLKKARESYLKLASSPFILPKYAQMFTILFLLGIASGIFLIVFHYIFYGILLIIGGACAGAYYLYLLKKSVSKGTQNEEIIKISQEFKRRFGISLNDIATLESELHQQERAFFELENKTKENTALEKELSALEDFISASLKKYNVKGTNPAKWDTHLDEIQKFRKDKEQEIRRAREKLAQLNVSESEYELNKPSEEFNHTKYEELKEELIALQQQEKDFKKIRNEHDNLDAEKKAIFEQIVDIIKTITGEEIQEKNLRETIAHIAQHHERLKTDIGNIKGELAGLGIAPRDYLKEDPGREYSHEEFQRIETEINEISKQFSEVESKMENLRKEIIATIHMSQTFEWNDLLEKLLQKKETTLRELQNIEAQIIAGKLISETIEELQTKADEAVTYILNSKIIQDVLSQFTGRYSTINILGDDIFISNDNDEFYLKDLSTGAKEQVMLALRIGFITHFLKNATAFFILDDAFQHSDYERRELLVKSLFNLAKRGWQTIYFSMDDHIRSLFKKYSKNFPDFKEIVLNP